MTPKRKSIADQLRDELRLALEQSTQEKVAGESGVSQSQLSRFLNNDRTPSLEVADRLCKYLGLVLKHK